MGFTPQQVNAMSPWQWSAVLEGWNAAHGDPEEQGRLRMTEEEADAAILAYETLPETVY